MSALEDETVELVIPARAGPPVEWEGSFAEKLVARSLEGARKLARSWANKLVEGKASDLTISAGLTITGTGEITGTGWLLAGPVMNQAIKANTLWPGPDVPPVTVVVQLNAEDIEFQHQGTVRNCSKWMDGWTHVVEGHINGVRVTPAEVSAALAMEDGSPRGLALRVWLLPADYKQWRGHVHAVPLSVSDLSTLAQTRGLEAESETVPSVEVLLGASRSKAAFLCPQEPRGMGLNMGPLPIMTMIGPGKLTIVPSRHQAEEQVT